MEEPDRERLLSSFGKHEAAKGCVYINKLADIDVDVLKALIKQTVAFTKARYSDHT
ncbi:hypothetical protein D3C86_2075630 [compost metagenome]